MKKVLIALSLVASCSTMAQNWVVLSEPRSYIKISINLDSVKSIAPDIKSYWTRAEAGPTIGIGPTIGSASPFLQHTTAFWENEINCRLKIIRFGLANSIQNGVVSSKESNRDWSRINFNEEQQKFRYFLLCQQGFNE